MKKNNFAFTMIELMIVIISLAVISLAIYSVFNTGIKIWQQVSKGELNDDLNIFFDKFSVELKNTFKYADYKFLGKKDKLIFTTLLNGPGFKAKTVGQVLYSYNYMSEEISREQKDFSKIYNKGTGPISCLLKGVKSCEFRYYFFDKEIKEYAWQDEWLEGKLPLAVRVELELDNGNGSDRFTKTVTIPIAS